MTSSAQRGMALRRDLDYYIGRPRTPEQMQRGIISRIVSIVFLLLAMAVHAGSPAIIPLPQQMQVRPGVFTLCPAQSIPGSPAMAAIKILTDVPSEQAGQYL